MTPHPLPTGYTLRHPTVADMPAAQRVLDAAESADCGEPRRHEQDLTLDCRDPHMDLARSTWVVDTAGALVAIAWVWAPLRTAEITADHCVHPEHRGRGIEESCLDLVEARALELAAAAPPGTAMRLVTWVESIHGDRLGSVAARGFTKTREYYSMIVELGSELRDPELPAPDLPEGLTVRPHRLGIDDRAGMRIARRFDVMEKPLP